MVFALVLSGRLEQKVNMTKLSTISKNHFAFECQCTHVALVSVKLSLIGMVLTPCLKTWSKRLDVAGVGVRTYSEPRSSMWGTQPSIA